MNRIALLGVVAALAVVTGCTPDQRQLIDTIVGVAPGDQCDTATAASDRAANVARAASDEANNAPFDQRADAARAAVTAYEDSVVVANVAASACSVRS